MTLRAALVLVGSTLSCALGLLALGCAANDTGSTAATANGSGGDTSATSVGSGGDTSNIGTGGDTSNIGAGGSTSATRATGGSSSTTRATGGSTATATGGATSTSTAAGGAPPISSLTCVQGESNCFSFFVTSRARLFKLAQAFNSASTKGWGGDFRYGQSDGLTGADKICTEIAEESLPGNGRTWKAFLSTSTVNAIDRVGTGPWYDRLNRIIANDLTELVATRPGGITNSTILNNLPNEDGTPHHNEESGCTNLNSCADNHDVLTGSDTNGKRCTSSTCSGGNGGGGGGTNITDYTCRDWTLGTSVSGIAPRVGHTWPTGGGTGGGSTGTDDWISRLTEAGCAPGYNLVQNGGPTANGLGSVGDGGGYGAIYCLAAK